MATDYARLREELREFYDFRDRTVLFVGAGGGQLLDWASLPRRCVAVDRDEAALEGLKSTVAARGLEGRMEVLAQPFEEVALRSDVVYFEFCLHEMEDPEAALRHAKRLAPDVVVFDHAEGSPWCRLGDEDLKVARSSEAIRRAGPRRRELRRAEQRFRDHADLLARIGPQGARAVARAEAWRGRTDIVVPMDYELALI
jgi:SAM-dependent methyltransferase